MSNPEPKSRTLQGRRVLVVEDEYFIADDLTRALKTLGADVVGPVASREEALALLSSRSDIHLAILDINLQDRMVYPVADALRERDIPFLFATGYDQSEVPGEYQDVPHWEKPFDSDALARALPSLLA
jgi:CheY-like chemotaxis protein